MMNNTYFSTKELFTQGPWKANLGKAEKLRRAMFSIPIFSGKTIVGRAYGATMEIAMANADLMVKAPEIYAENKTLFKSIWLS